MRISDWSSDVCSSDLLALLVGDALRQRLGRFENERIRPRRQLLEQAELAIVDACVSGDLGQVATDQRELVMAVEITNAAQAVGRITIIEMAAQGVTGVGWISDHRDGAYPLDDLHQDRKRVVKGTRV